MAIGPVLKFLQAARNLAKQGMKKEQVMEFAKREFGEVNDLLKRQIEQIFTPKSGGITSLRKPEGKVIEASFKPGMSKSGKVVEESPSQASGIMSRLEGKAEQLRKTVNLSSGLSRTLAREILMNKGIKIAKGIDPLELLNRKFGADVVSEVSDLADELVEMERKGEAYKDINTILKQEGLLDVQIPGEPRPGFSAEELEEIQKAIDEEDMLLKFDPKDREPNAMGGFNRANFAIGSGVKGLAAALKTIMSKYGKDSITTADKIAQREKKTEVLVREFEKRDRDRVKQEAIEKYGITPERYDEIMEEGGKLSEDFLPDADDMQRELIKPSREILDVPEVPKGFKLSKEKLMDKFPEIDEDFANQMMGMNKDMQGRIIKMLENRRLDPEAYDRLLEQYGDTLEFQKEFDKVVRRKQNADGGLNYLMGM